MYFGMSVVNQTINYRDATEDSGQTRVHAVRRMNTGLPATLC
jgi:hypothetical protein